MNVLLATDGSKPAEAAANLLKRLPLPPTTELSLLTVSLKLDQASVSRESPSEVMTPHADELLAQESARFDDTGWKVHTIAREGNAAHEIIEAASELRTNLVVVGAKGLSGLKRFLLGSVSQKVMKYSPCSVLVVRHRERDAGTTASDSPLRIVLAYDDSEPAKRAAQFLGSLARQDRVEVLVVTVQVLVTTFRMDLKQKQDPLWREQQLKANADLERVVQELRSLTPHVTSQLLEGDDASDEILNVSGDFDADMIVLGATGHAGIERFLLGSVANRVLHHANCSVLVARG